VLVSQRLVTPFQVVKWKFGSQPCRQLIEPTITMTHKHHRLFDIPEMLTDIFLGLAEPDCWGRCLTSADLARAARCSKKFSTPALVALWQTMHSELPLSKLLPGFQEVDDIWVRHISLHILPACCSPYRFYLNLNLFVILTGKGSMDMRGALDTYA
jgi:hypothetical protein